MAHVRRSISGGRISSAASTAQITANIVAADTVLCIMIKTVGATNRAGGSPTMISSGTALAAAANGVYTFTQANTTQKAATSPEASCELWYLLNPPAGSWTINMPNSGLATIFYTIEAGQAQAGMTSAFDGASGANATAVNPAPGAIVTTGTGDIVWAITAGGWTTWAPTPQVGTVIANTDDGADGGGEQYTIQAAAGSINLGWTFATSDDWGAVAAAFKEVADPAYTNNYQNVQSTSPNAGVISTSGGIK